MSYTTADGTSDVLGGTATGAATGAAIGSVVPGVGTAIGAVAGGVVGLLSGAIKAWASSESESEKQEIIDDVAEQYGVAANEVEDLFKNYYEQDPTLSNTEGIKKVQKNLESYDPTKYAYEPGKFSDEYTKTEEDFVDPYKDDIVNAAEAAVSHSAAGAALGRGTGAAKAIASKTAEVEGDLADKAWNRYMQDRSEAYNEYNGYITQMQNYLNNLNSSAQWKMSQENNLNTALAENELEVARQQVEDLAGLKTNTANANMYLQLAKV